MLRERYLELLTPEKLFSFNISFKGKNYFSLINLILTRTTSRRYWRDKNLVAVLTYIASFSFHFLSYTKCVPSRSLRNYISISAQLFYLIPDHIFEFRRMFSVDLFKMLLWAWQAACDITFALCFRWKLQKGESHEGFIKGLLDYNILLLAELPTCCCYLDLPLLKAFGRVSLDVLP